MPKSAARIVEALELLARALRNELLTDAEVCTVLRELGIDVAAFAARVRGSIDGRSHPLFLTECERQRVELTRQELSAGGSGLTYDPMGLIAIIDRFASPMAPPQISAEVLDIMDRDGWTPQQVRALIADYRRHFYPTPHVEFDVLGNWIDDHDGARMAFDPYPLPDMAKAEVRLRFVVESDKRAAARAAAEALKTEWLSAGAVSVKLEEEVLTVNTARAPESRREHELAAELEGLGAAELELRLAAFREELLKPVDELRRDMETLGDVKVAGYLDEIIQTARGVP